MLRAASRVESLYSARSREIETGDSSPASAISPKTHSTILSLGTISSLHFVLPAGAKAGIERESGAKDERAQQNTGRAGMRTMALQRAAHFFNEAFPRRTWCRKRSVVHFKVFPFSFFLERRIKMGI